MTAREVLDGIKARLAAATPGPWEPSQGATSDGTELVTTMEQKAAFLALSLNDDESPLWLVHNNEVIPAATGDGPRAQANAEFIAAAPATVARLTAALEAVLTLHAPISIYECDDNGFAQTEDESKFVRDICGTCSDTSVTESLDDGNYDLAGEYGEVSHPCPTVAAIEGALKEGQ